jgi:hypothetical protein
MNDNTITHSKNLLTADPELAAQIARFVNRRCVAVDMINTVLQREVFRPDDFEFWKAEHMEATAELGKLGIKLHTYSNDERTP